MKLKVTGLSHNASSVCERERVLAELKNSAGILLSTCNRVELYSAGEDVSDRFEGGYNYSGVEAVRHLFRVASGMDSQILGETEILGQVRDAGLKLEKDEGFSRQLFLKAVEVGRRVRAETGISRGNVSIASVAIKKSLASLGSFEGKKIVLIGAGKVTSSILRTLLKSAGSVVCVANRTYDKAREITDVIGGRAVRFSELPGELADADLVISSTAAPHIVLRKGQILKREKPLMIMDLALPRDVQPEVSDVAMVTLFSIDCIKEEINLSLIRRKVESLFAERIVAEEVKKFCELYELEAAAVA
jgi:glutamyl-tRNA reductase